LADNRAKPSKKKVRRGFVIALVVIVLAVASIGTGFAFSAFQLLVQADATLRDLTAYNQIRQKASQGYDVREARAKWLESIRAYQRRQFIKADGLANDAFADLKIKKILMPYYSVIGGTPDEVPQEYAVRSAVNYVNSIQAPILIIHGAKDPIVPVSQAEEMYQALRNAGKTVEMKIYPNEGHGVSDRRAQVKLWLLTFSWFEKYL